ncbi:DUF262 domain-containing protein [Heliobacterium gestii]|uniref:DUF262 domain-containing protein n=2 Tax=Heliomicrobium gestii TaxID=2699 RepID=A0A845LDF0_HELGE|nr:DUF262 domain-containing protein [Heliomicrobium gestii]
MSVGELLTMYKDGDLVLRPEFQRFFRWSPEQKSRLVESLLLGIPIPSIFVSQRNDGKWEVIDGLQRLSTLFELAGELRNPDGEKRPPLVLTKTKFLTDLKDLQWESEDKSKLFPEEAKRRIKRSRIDVSIVLSTSDLSAKYELFQRLNTGGSLATDQEVRNAILVMINRDFFTWVSELANRDYFRKCIPLTDRALEEQFDLELVTRFIVLSLVENSKLREIEELGVFLTEKIVEMAEDTTFDKEKVTRAFHRTFEALSRILGEQSFKKYDEAKQHAMGAMLISIFEVLAIGIGTYAGDPTYVIPYEKIRELHRRLAKEIRFTSSGSGISATRRIPNTVGLGREFFAP